MSAEICATCSEEFAEKWMLDAHYAGHENALKWCTEIQKIKLSDYGLDPDDLEDFSQLYVSDSEDEIDEEQRFEFDFSQITKAAKMEVEQNGNNSNNKSLSHYEEKYDPMMEDEEDEDGEEGLPALEELPIISPLALEFTNEQDVKSEPMLPVLATREPEVLREAYTPSTRPGLRTRKKKVKKEDGEKKDDEPEVEENPPKVPRKLGRRTFQKPEKVETALALVARATRNPEIVHVPGKPKKCQFCSKQFRSLAQLSQHERCHTGEKPFVCEFCRKSFRQKAHLTTHLRIHTGDRPFVCNLCGKGFIQSQHLKNHTRLHTGEKPFQCGICRKYFSQISNLRHHERCHQRDA